MTSAAFLERLNRLKADEAAKAPQTSQHHLQQADSPAVDAIFAEDIPVLDRDDDRFVEERQDLDTVMSQIDIRDAYDKWVGKKHEPWHTKKREGIKVSCPIPTHPDDDPSAWINVDKQLWFCGGCQEGGDKFDLASFRFGHNYKVDPAAFVELKKAMAGEFGWVTKTNLSGQHYVEKQEEWVEQEESENNDAPIAQTPFSAAPNISSTSETTSTSSASQPADTSASSVTESSSSGSGANDLLTDSSRPFVDTGNNYPSLAWRTVVQKDTFLDIWMNEFAVPDDLPEEYYFFHGLVAIGAAVGRQASLEQGDSVYPNLLLCLIGNTGIGKSRSSSKLVNLLQQSLPYDYANPLSQGVKHVPLPGSGESLQKSFSQEITDPNDPKKVLGYAPVRGLVDFDEFANLTARASRSGSTLQQTLMRLYDGYVSRQATHSLTHGAAVVENPFCMGVATTQPRNIQTLVSRFDKSSGFLNRWCFVTGNPKKPIAIQKHQFSLDASRDALRKIHTWAGKVKHIDFEPQAEIEYVRFFDEVIAITKVENDVTEGLLSRLDLTAKKMMLILACNEHLSNITVEIVEKMKILYRYLESTFMYVNGYIGTHDDLPVQEAITDQIGKHMAKHKRPIKKRELFKSGITRHFSSEKLVRVMKTMIELGFIEEIQITPARGPKTQGYKLPAD